MHATPAISQAPIASDPAQFSVAASANSVTSDGKGANFAAALCKAGVKPNRKSAAGLGPSGAAGSCPDGGQLPGTGNLSPPPTVPAAATGAAPDVSAGRSAPVGDSASGSEAKAAVQSAAGAAGAAPGPAQTPAAGGAAVAGANGAPTPGLPGPAGRPAAAVAEAAAASATAASAAAVATATAGTIGTDKHARSDSGNSLLADVSAGAANAAQLSVNGAGAGSPGGADAVSPTLKVTAVVDSAEFGQGVADRVSWMVDNNLSSAKLQINPPQLGPIEVRIAVQGDHAQVWLTSHSALTRDALEQSSPKLREMLGAQGFGQVSVDISQRNFQDRSAHAQPYKRSAVATVSSAAVSAVTASVPRLSNGAVDAYA